MTISFLHASLCQIFTTENYTLICSGQINSYVTRFGKTCIYACFPKSGYIAIYLATANESVVFCRENLTK